MTKVSHTMTPDQLAAWEREMREARPIPRMPEQLRDLMQPGVEYTVTDLLDSFAPEYSDSAMRSWLGELERADRIARITLDANDPRRHMRYHSADHVYVRDES